MPREIIFGKNKLNTFDASANTTSMNTGTRYGVRSENMDGFFGAAVVSVGIAT